MKGSGPASNWLTEVVRAYAKRAMGLPEVRSFAPTDSRELTSAAFAVIILPAEARPEPELSVWCGRVGGNRQEA